MSTASGAGSVPGANGAPARERPADLRSAELVSRLLAATPPYLYNMPIVPHSYFFSEMLRSFVHAKNNNEANRLATQNANQPPTHRRSRKRSWNQSKISPTLESSHLKDWQHRPDPWQLRNPSQHHEERHHCEDKYPEQILDNNKNHSYEKPLELTINKSGSGRAQHSDIDDKRDSPDIDVQVKTRKSPKLVETAHMKDEKFSDIMSQNPAPPTLPLPPPPPPLWYPPLYPPPYGIDPLNFFIDLRVSGHIYDRKHGAKDAQNLSTNMHQEQDAQQTPNVGPLIFENSNTSAFKENVKSNRHLSAFSVPKPRESKQFPINLCHAGNSKFNMKYFDDIDSKIKEREKSSTSTHYVMQNLKRIYGELSNRSEEAEDGDGGGKAEPEPEMSGDLDGANDSDSSETKKKRCKDLRALIGLELVVDYVKGGRVAGNGGRGDGPASDVEVLEDQ